jgi:hypothetical protein
MLLRSPGATGVIGAVVGGANASGFDDAPRARILGPGNCVRVYALTTR